MLAYAPRRERCRLQPSALVLIVGAHVAAILAVMSVKMEVERRGEPPIDVISIPLPPEPQPPKPATNQPVPPNQTYTAPRPVIDPLALPTPTVDPLPMPPDPGPLIGNGVDPSPPKPLPIIRTGPRFVTPAALIRPPYPEEKRRLEQEATLRLRLAIDEHGRVVTVEPVGSADPAFLAAARRHILKAWRYQPAMEGDHAIPSSTVITLQFKLD
jgi:protein TonB